MKKDWQNQKSYRMSRGRLIGTLRTQWLADINWDHRQPAAPTYPLINWTGEKR